MIGEKATLYHSALVHAGPVEVTITCDKPIRSRFDGKPDYISLKHEGASHTYNIENQACADALTGLKGQVVTIEATGREDDAAIYVTDVNGDPVSADQAPAQRQAPARQPQRQAPPARQQAPAQRQQAPAQRQAPAHNAPPKLTPEEKAKKEEVAFRKMKQTGARVSVALESSIRFAEKLFVDLGYGTTDTEGFFKVNEGVTFEDVRAFAITHFIETKSITDINALPMKWLDLSKPEPQPPPQRQPPPRQQHQEPEPQHEPPEERRAGGGAPYSESPEEDDIPF